MSKFVLKDAYVSINGTAISDHCSSCTVETSADEVEFTSFGPAGFREFGQGLKDATVTLAAFSDYDSGSIDAIFNPYFTSGGTFTVMIKPTSAAVGTANPSYTMTGRLYSYSPVSGAVGDAATTDISIRNAGTAGLVRATV